MKRFLNIISLFSCMLASAQSKPVTIHARVVGEDSKPMSNVMVINKRTLQGFIAEIDGTFKTAALRTDTLVILCRGFNDLCLSLRDSVPGDELSLTLHLVRKTYIPKEKPVNPRPPRKKPVETDPVVKKKDSLANDSLFDYFDPEAHKLKQVTVYGTKSPDQIHKEIDSLQLENTDDYQSYNALASPITALYERFSKREGDKRKVAELIYEDHKKEVLRDLLALYISYDVLELTDEEFDEFLNGIYVPDEVLRTYSDYKLGEFIRKQYLAFREYKKQHGDYNDALKKFNQEK